MHNFRRSFALISIFIFFIMICAVNATDNETQILNDTDSEIIESNQINISSNEYTDFQTAVHESNDGDVIEIEGEFIKHEYLTEIINKSITIQGSSKGAIINCNHTGQVFYLQNSTLTLNNIKIINFEHSFATGTEKDFANIKIINCTFENGRGNIFGSLTNLTIIDSKFQNFFTLINQRVWAGQSPMDAINIINSSFNLFRYALIDVDKFKVMNINNCSFTNFENQLLGTFKYDYDMMINFTQNTVINSTSFLPLFTIEATNLNFSRNTIKNIHSEGYITADFMDFSRNSIDNITKIEITCPKIDLSDCIIRNVYPDILQSEYIYGENLIIECENIIFKNTHLYNAIINLMESPICSIEDSTVHNSIITVFKFKSFNMQNSNIVNSTFPISAKTVKLVNNNLTNVDSVDFSSTSSTEISSCNLVNISGIDIISKKVTFKNSKFINLFEDNLNGICITQFNDLIMDGCEFRNCRSTTTLLYLQGNNIDIKNSCFYDNQAKNSILNSIAKNFSLTYSAISNNKAESVITHYDNAKKKVTTYFNLYHNILAGNYDKNNKNAYYSFIFNTYEYKGDTRYYTKFQIRDNFYGFNIVDEYELDNVAIVEYHLQKSWINLNAQLIKDNTYMLKYMTNNGKSISLKDYVYSIVNKKTNQKITEVEMKNGVGEMKLPEGLKLDDVYIMNRANHPVNKPQAKITLTKVGSNYEDYKITVKLTDNNGNPIRNARITIDVIEKSKAGSTSIPVYFTTNNQGVCYIVTHISHLKAASNVDKFSFSGGNYDVKIKFSNDKYAFATAGVKNIAFKKVPAKAILKKLTTTYNSNVKMVVKILSKKTNKGLYSQSGHLYVYKGSKLIKTVFVNTNRKGIFNYNPSKLGIGKYKIKFKPESKYNEAKFSQVTSTLKIKKAKTIVKAPKIKAKYGKNKYFKVTVKHKISKKAQKGVIVKIKVAGKTFKVKTNKKGIAKISTKNLSVGTHKVSIKSGDSKYIISKKSSIKIGR